MEEYVARDGGRPLVVLDLVLASRVVFLKLFVYPLTQKRGCTTVYCPRLTLQPPSPVSTDASPTGQRWGSSYLFIIRVIPLHLQRFFGRYGGSQTETHHTYVFLHLTFTFRDSY